MTTSGDGARIKVFGGIPPTSTSLSSGGGTGYVRNVTYNGIHDVSDDCKSASFQVTWYESNNLRNRCHRVDAMLRAIQYHGL